MFFSIIIPTRNEEKRLGYCLPSLLNQTFQDFEVIVVDDGSTDSTEEIVARFASKKIRYFKKRNDSYSFVEERSV
jgi:glycosyltransferase involved in cell wall biosynthesis